MIDPDLIPMQSAGAKLVIAYRVKKRLGRYSHLEATYYDRVDDHLALRAQLESADMNSSEYSQAS